MDVLICTHYLNLLIAENYIAREKWYKIELEKIYLPFAKKAGLVPTDNWAKLKLLFQFKPVATDDDW